MKVSVTGISDINHVLETIAPRESKNLMRAVVYDMASQLAEDAKVFSPDDTGTLDRSIKPRRERGSRSTVEATVRVSMKAFYWIFLEYGDGPDKVEHAMFLKALQKMRPQADRVYLEAFVRKLESRLARERKRMGA